MEFAVNTNKKEEIVDITGKINEIVYKASDEDSKACLVYAKHTTCSIIINENYDGAVCKDILDYLRKSIPAGKWKHDKKDNNGDAHVKAAILGPSQLIPIENGKLQLGTWQGIALAEFDGPKERKIVVKIM